MYQHSSLQYIMNWLDISYDWELSEPVVEYRSVCVCGTELYKDQLFHPTTQQTEAMDLSYEYTYEYLQHKRC